jgi:hypothetical protein
MERAFMSLSALLEFLDRTDPPESWVDEAIARLRLPPKEQRGEGDYARLHQYLTQPEARPVLGIGSKFRYIGTDKRVTRWLTQPPYEVRNTIPGHVNYWIESLNSFSTWIPVADCQPMENT